MACIMSCGGGITSVTINGHTSSIPEISTRYLEGICTFRRFIDKCSIFIGSHQSDFHWIAALMPHTNVHRLLVHWKCFWDTHVLAELSESHKLLKDTASWQCPSVSKQTSPCMEVEIDTYSSRRIAIRYWNGCLVRILKTCKPRCRTLKRATTNDRNHTQTKQEQTYRGKPTKNKKTKQNNIHTSCLTYSGLPRIPVH